MHKLCGGQHRKSHIHQPTRGAFIVRIVVVEQAPSCHVTVANGLDFVNLESTGDCVHDGVQLVEHVAHLCVCQ